jgi:hypothetical protein
MLFRHEGVCLRQTVGHSLVSRLSKCPIAAWEVLFYFLPPFLERRGNSVASTGTTLALGVLLQPRTHTLVLQRLIKPILEVLWCTWSELLKHFCEFKTCESSRFQQMPPNCWNNFSDNSPTKIWGRSSYCMTMLRRKFFLTLLIMSLRNKKTKKKKLSKGPWPSD